MTVTATLSNPQAAAYLVELGWPKTVPMPHAVRAFQAGYTYRELPITGQLDVVTSAAIAYSVQLSRSGHGSASDHFSFREFACRCGGADGCDVIWVKRELLTGLERLRNAYYPSGLVVVSGCRCARRNAEAGGARDSQHLYGAACDVKQTITPEQVAELRMFSGIGTFHGLVCHVDVRHRSGHNTTGSTTADPAIFVEG